MAIANREEIINLLETLDLNELLDRMENYVRDRFYDKNEYSKKGFNYLDFCADVILKACDGTRNWDKSKTSFENFIFGSLKSDLYNYFRKNSNKTEENIDDDECYIIEYDSFTNINENSTEDDNVLSQIDFKIISEECINTLKAQGVNQNELDVFECWLCGYTKPTEIADVLDITTRDVNNIVKRLSRRTIKLKEAWGILKR